MSVNETELERWLEGYRRAWETRDPEAASALFSEDARYYETPFQAPAQGRDGVRGYWEDATRNQSDVAFAYEVLCVSGDRGMARWSAKFTRIPSGVTASLDGVFLLQFDEDGLCGTLREWWHITETVPDDV